jgi:HEAT repeat protein
MTTIEQLIQDVRTGSAKATERLGTLESEVQGGLGALRGEAIAALVEALTNGSASIRFEAAWALMSFRGDAACAAPLLVKLLKDPDAQVRSQAAETLGGVGAPARFLPELIDALGADEPSVRSGAADALAYLGADAVGAVSDLTVALADSDRFVRLSAASALGAIGAGAAAAMPALFQAALTADIEDDTAFLSAMESICQASSPAVAALRELLAAQRIPLRAFLKVVLQRIAGLS